MSRPADDEPSDGASPQGDGEPTEAPQRLSGARCFLKVCSILLFVGAGLSLLWGAILFWAGGTASGILPITGDDITNRTTASAAGMGIIVVGVIEIIVGLLGLRGVNHPEHVLPILVVAALVALFSAYGCLTSFTYGILASTVFNAAMTIAAWTVYRGRTR